MSWTRSATVRAANALSNSCCKTGAAQVGETTSGKARIDIDAARHDIRGDQGVAVITEDRQHMRTHRELHVDRTHLNEMVIITKSRRKVR